MKDEVLKDFLAVHTKIAKLVIKLFDDQEVKQVIVNEPYVGVKSPADPLGQLPVDDTVTVAAVPEDKPKRGRKAKVIEAPEPLPSDKSMIDLVKAATSDNSFAEPVFASEAVAITEVIESVATTTPAPTAAAEVVAFPNPHAVPFSSYASYNQWCGRNVIPLLNEDGITKWQELNSMATDAGVFAASDPAQYRILYDSAVKIVKDHSK